MTLDTALLDRCVRAYIGIELRKEGMAYDGPCPDDLLLDAGFDADADYHRACSRIVDEAQRRIEAGDVTVTPDVVPTPHACGCGRLFPSHRGLRNHERFCARSASLEAEIIRMHEDGATHAVIQEALKTSPNRIVDVLRKHRRAVA